MNCEYMCWDLRKRGNLKQKITVHHEILLDEGSKINFKVVKNGQSEGGGRGGSCAQVDFIVELIKVYDCYYINDLFSLKYYYK